MIRKLLFFISLILLLVAGVAGVAYSKSGDTPASQTQTIHPQFAFLDTQGQNVLKTDQPISTMQTCGQCHDTTFIAGHSFHVDLGQSDTASPGKWNPLTYRYQLPDDDFPGGLDTADWVKANAARLVGDGPAEPVNLEMDCFLCHIPDPNHEEQQQTLQNGQFDWANTATLLGSGLVEQTDNGYTWNQQAFDSELKLKPELVTIQDPTNDNCAGCHGVVHTPPEPLTLSGCELSEWQTATTGQVMSPEKISNSGMNLSAKETLDRPFDIHIERGLQCTDCHYSLNNPVYYQSESPLDHLQFDPRRLEIGEYLLKPDHNFARGQSAQTTIAPELKGTMRRCESCHNAKETHTWLPYVDRHMDELACESCHIPQMYAPAVQAYDWTVLQPSSQPVSTCRGAEGNTGTLADLVTGFAPVLMPRQNIDGKMLVAPYNLITTWYWVYDGESGTVPEAGPYPVSQDNLKAAWFTNGQYAPEILAALDMDKNGSLSQDELVLDTAEKQAVVAGRLASLGLNNPRIEGVIQPYSINHNVATGEWAIKECKTCHAGESLISQPMKLANTIPGGVQPEFVNDSNVVTNGSLYTEANALYYQPATRDQNLYIFGHDRVSWIDWIGALFFLGVLGAVITHGSLRFYAALKSPRPKPEFKKVYMYTVYERFWHWLQTFLIVTLLFTGLIIHRPDIFSVFRFPYVVTVHNVVAVLLVINAGLSLFYHLTSGEIRQFIPRPYGFFDDAILQAKYYFRGIFKGEEHPFEKVSQRKLNPLQQITYFAILNVLLPLQIITGALMWGVQRWPQVSGWFGGLPYLAPFHSLVAWMFASFIVAHVYLTTTGAKPLTSIEAMMMGWEDIEVHEGLTYAADEPKPEHNNLNPDIEASAG